MNFKHFIVALILPLFERSGPSAIIRAVIAIVIYSFNCCSGWAWRHVGIKIFKCIPPATHLNPSTTVHEEVRIIMVVASSSHGTPKLIDICLAHTVRCFLCCCDFLLQTAAGFRFARDKPGGLNASLGPAQAATKPERCSVFCCANSIDNGPIAKYLTCNIFKLLCHDIISA